MTRAPRPPTRRLRLEHLEDRTTPATFAVMNLNDAGAGSLRDAIDQANASPDPDTIVFDPSVKGGTIGLSTFINRDAVSFELQPAGPSALLVFTPITIQGTGQTLARPGGTTYRLFQVTAAGDLTLQNLTLRGGRMVGGSGGGGGGGAAGMGGAIYNQGTLTVVGCTLTSNQAVGGGSAGGVGGGGGGLGGPNNDNHGGAPNGGAVAQPPGVGGAGGFGGGGGAGAGGLGGSGGFGGGGGGGGIGGEPGFGGGGGAGAAIGGTGGPGGFGGAGSSTGPGAGSGLGGAIFNQGGTVAISNSTITANTAQGGAASGGGQNGGGYGGGIFNLNGNLILTNVTVAGNTVQAGVGGVANTNNGTELYNASVNAGAVTPAQQAVVTLANSILAHTGTTTASTASNYKDAASPGTAILNFNGPNIVLGVIGNTAGSLNGTAYTPADPLLGPLADNGGPTQTMALLPFSPAINTGGNASAVGLTTDQRGPGFVRVSNGVVDQGAFEFQVPVVLAPASLPDGRVGTAFTQAITASGPPGPYAFTVTAGALPPGLTLSGTGVLSGTPTRDGTFAFTVTATNATAEAGSRPYTATVSPSATSPPPPASPPGSPPGPPSVRVGFPQFAVGGGAGSDGRARFFNPDGTERSSLTPFPGATGGVRTAAADFNGDGVADVVAGTGPGVDAAVRILDGKDGHELFSLTPFPGFTGGVFVAAGDLTGDGTPDLIVTPDLSGGPRVRVFRGGDFAQVADFLGINDPAFRGGARAAAGDVDGDGKADLVVAAGFGGGPRVAVFSGAKVTAEGTSAGLTADRIETWKLVGDFIAFDPALRNGVYVGAGDLDGDGRADLVFGAGPGGGPEVRAVSGAKFLGAGGPSLTTSAADPARLADFFAGDVNNRGGLRVAAKDLDVDGKADLVVGPGDAGGSHVTAYPSKTLGPSGGPSSLSFDAFPGFANGVFVG